MASRGSLPRKVDGLHVQEFDGEFVVIDEATQQAHALSGVAAALWRGIDADTWPAASAEDLDAAVVELETLGLIWTSGVSRRVLMRTGTIAIAGGIVTIGLPSMAMAASGPIATGTSLASTPASPPAGGPTFSITVTVAPAPLDGTVTLKKNGVQVGTSQSAAGGSVSFSGLSAGTTPGGSDVYSAAFTGSVTSGGSSGSLTVTYGSSATTSSLTGPAAAISGSNQNYVLTVTSGAGTPVGSGTLYTRSGGVDTLVTGQANKALSGGTVTFTIPAAPAGSTVYVAKFTPTVPANFAASPSGTVTTTTTKANTNVTVTGLKNGKGATYSSVVVTVASVGGGTPAGNVTFSPTTGGATAANNTVGLSEGGTAIFSITNPNANSSLCVVQFAYVGDGSDNAKTATGTYTTTNGTATGVTFL
jgi:hypothetical protein